MRPVFCWKCKECGDTQESYARYANDPCGKCGGQMRRDWSAEGMAHDFHPSIDLYGKRNADRIRKGVNLGD